MFSKKTCKKCGKKSNKNYSFCPICGTPFGKNRNKEDYGILGENDSFNERDLMSNSLFGGFGGKMMNNMLNNAIKMLEKEMQREMQNNSKVQNQNNLPNTKIKLMINGKEINLNNGIPITNQKEVEKKEKKQVIKFHTFSDSQAKKFSKLTKKEPKTDLKRIADRIHYEIEMPGVEAFEDISIRPLENSIEIKALAKEKAYSKSIQMNLPIVAYNFSKGLLILEF